MFEITVEKFGIKAVFKNTVLATLKYRKFREVLKFDIEDSDADVKLLFCEAVAHMIEITGVKWKIPDISITEEELEKSYYGLLSQISFELLEEWHSEIFSLHTPLSEAVEKPVETLTEEERADPN